MDFNSISNFMNEFLNSRIIANPALLPDELQHYRRMVDKLDLLKQLESILCQNLTTSEDNLTLQLRTAPWRNLIWASLARRAYYGIPYQFRINFISLIWNR